MKYSLVLFIAMVFTVSNITAQNYGLGNTDPAVFTKYRVPETNLYSLWFNTALSLTTSKTFDNQPIFSDYSYYNSMFKYSLSPSYILRKEREDRVLSISTNLSGSYQYNYSERNGEYTDKNSNYSLNLGIKGSINNYFNSDNKFYSIGAELNFFAMDRRQDAPSIQLKNQYIGAKTQNYIVSFGFGVGKVRNITPVISAIRFQERLKQLSLANNDLSEKTILDLSQQFSRRSYYSQVHDRSGKYFWDDLEGILNKDGVSLQGINMYGTNYLMEAPYDYRFVRMEGMTTGINIQIDYSNTYRSGNEFQIPILEEQLNILGNAYINYSHQLNLNSQVHCSLSLSGGSNIITNPEVKQKYIISTSLGYDYEITDRIVTSVNNNFGTSFFNESAQRKEMINNFSLSLDYFIEDNLLLYVTYNWDFNETKQANRAKYSVNNNNVQLGFTYYFDRGFIYH